MLDHGPEPDPRLVLLVRARNGDVEALGRLLERYRDDLMLLSRFQVGARLRGKVDPADLVQETFLEAHRDFEQFRGTTEKEFAAWLRRILAANLANVIRHYFGTQRRDMNLERELIDSFSELSRVSDRGLMAQQETPSQHASRREQAVILAEALRDLSEDYREVIVLRHLEGMSFPEISKRMGRTEDSVKKLWARALARLRRQMRAVP
ncbi:sigma-70 family RNA polymerase sigma factor [Tautonia sociabilis]|uniref:Sigma-70 family RNA polymerase sigma factor n=1 Tax=Tautonia sociabilis TaxID=2080755 RepID=A0A432MMC3_9BACT|nr:sigma-70 family RNA polymerase sigma factor [Tautonia sociabilis]RUL88409.1 sigma-70 family RNA polymerase sigma factor [Tautonia sociabilis]